MHVKTLALTLALVLVACDGPPVGNKGSSAVASASASALDAPLAFASVSPPDAAQLSLARRCLDSATALATKCRLTKLTDGLTITEYCEWRPDDIVPLREAAAALRASPNLPRTGSGASFVEQVRMFAEWTELVHDLSKRGTLSHYQDLASAWNAWRPSDKVAVDPVSLPKYTFGDGGFDGGMLAWERCSQGPCVVTGIVPSVRGR